MISKGLTATKFMMAIAEDSPAVHDGVDSNFEFEVCKRVCLLCLGYENPELMGSNLTQCIKQYLPL
jgi:hypothetical protein